MEAGLRCKKQKCPLTGHILWKGHKYLMKTHMIPWNIPKDSILKMCQYTSHYGGPLLQLLVSCR